MSADYVHSAAGQAQSAFVPHDLAAPLSGAPRGPLAGLTLAVKDLYEIEGARTGGGSPEWLAAQTPARATAPAVRRLLEAGATVIGKTICDEFFYSVTGANAHYGTPMNPRAPDRMPGGSSSGSASATAAGACDFALGSDTGGSVRVPASFCGLYGIRPTLGRVDLSGAMPMAPSFDVAGWFAGGPGVFRKVGEVLLGGQRLSAPIERLMIAEDAFAEADADVTDLAGAVLTQAAHLLPKPEPERLAPDGLDAWRECFRTIQAHEVWQAYGDFISRVQPRLGPGIKERMQFASMVPARDAEVARGFQHDIRTRVHLLVQPGTVIVLPASPSVAPLLTTEGAVLDAFRVRVMRMTCIAGLSGLPQVSLPLGWIGGCPVGLSFIAWAGGDEALLDLAVRLSRFSVYR